MDQQVSGSKRGQMRGLSAAAVVDQTATETQEICATRTKKMRTKTWYMIGRSLEQCVANEEI